MISSNSTTRTLSSTAISRTAFALQENVRHISKYMKK